MTNLNFIHNEISQPSRCKVVCITWWRISANNLQLASHHWKLDVFPLRLWTRQEMIAHSSIQHLTRILSNEIKEETETEGMAIEKKSSKASKAWIGNNLEPINEYIARLQEVTLIYKLNCFAIYPQKLSELHCLSIITFTYSRAYLHINLIRHVWKMSMENRDYCKSSTPVQESIEKEALWVWWWNFRYK